ncbi:MULTISPECIES: hypothetical protein [Delftia]|uniref:hypothetical protein n=1 Tax=Delftia TaxID=80865 RepID=UPI0009B77384|nr:MULTISPECIES: hypothetical protein [Delftia]MDH0775575.1 hypothetical protein [Delftia tsuruhatensis]MDH0847746.1 hypothetical protein [Delftia tsuruhatensis]MDH1461670.1 hypothetical protein [Delftia tsuruhatensis]MDH1826239.1 hypothetical protein [Delftia tsuruhatensis]TDF23698.1 hypothetical protein EZI45_24730 [Delftia tsuruhatensis]
MNAIELMIFLGHSSTHEPFDEFLTKNGIKSRPKIGRSLETLIPIKGQGLSMSFEIDAKGNGIAPKSEGAFIFSQLEIRISGDVGKNGIYTGPLPYGLSANDSRDAIEKKLGQLKRRMPEIDNYFLDGVVWTVAFEEDKLEFFQLGVPTNGKRKHGLCP